MISTPRGATSLLSDRTFGPYFFGNLISNCGTWFQNVAAAVVVFNLTGSAVLVGAVSVAQMLPSLLLSLPAGALTDRVDRRKLLLAGQLLCACASGSLAVWTGLVGVEGLPGIWPVLGASLILGVGIAFSIPAMQALVPALVRPEDLDLAIALNSVTFNVARAIGPALGAATLVAFGPAAAFAVNAGSYLVLVTMLLAVKQRDVERSLGGDRSIRASLLYVRADRTSLMLLVGVAALGFGTDPVYTLTPPLAEALGGGDRLVGLLVSAFGSGAVVSAVLVGRLRRHCGQRSLGLAGLVGLGGGMLGLAVSPNQTAALVSLAVAGSGYLFATTALTTLLQQRVPEDLRGRVMALWTIAFLGSRPLAALIDGALADLASVRVAVVFAAIVPLVSAAIVRRDAVRVP
ncbi:MAG: MFS transporter [Egibacteraceae bacterium]